jgi:hypothetical protein
MRTFVAVIFVAIVSVCACHACVGAHVTCTAFVGHVIDIGHTPRVGVHVWVCRTLVGAAVLLVHEGRSLLGELAEIHDDCCLDGRCDLYGRLIKVVKERISWRS